MTRRRTRDVQCWACGHNINGTSGMTGPIDAPPRAGDIGVCLYCRAVGVFTGDGVEQRPPTMPELDALERDDRIPVAMSIATRVHMAISGERL